MRGALLALILLSFETAAGAELRSVGVYGQWGAFRKDDPRSCYAIAEPFRAPRAIAWKPFAAVGTWPRRNIRSQIHFRLSREKREGSAVLLKIADQTFQLLAGKLDAWAADARADAQIVTAMRSGVDMTIETRAANGTLVRDTYRLQGAATAIDAAAIACSS
jgi:hypothetical protein